MIRKTLPKIMRSYGCQLGVFEYLSDLEVLQLQLIERDTYGRTIARYQETFPIRNEMIALTYPNGKIKKNIMLLDGVNGEVKTFEDERFDFTDTRKVVVKKELYAFKYGCSVSAYKISDFPSTDHLVTTLSTLPLNERLNFLQ